MSFQRKVRIWVFLLDFSICEDSCKDKKYLYLGQKLLYVCLFGQEFEKAVVIFEINASNLSNCIVWCKIKILKFGTKMSDLHIFGVEFENTIVIFEICVLEFVLLQSLVQKQKSWKKNFMKKTKMPKFGTKNSLFGYFWLELENKILTFEINTPNLSNCKISW